MFGPIWQFFFQGDGEAFAQWTVFVPPVVTWEQQDAEIATITDVQE